MKPTLLKTLSVFGVACALTVALEAADGVLLVTKTTTGAESSTSQIQIERNRMRAEVHEPSVGNQTIIFDGTRQAMDIIDVSKKTYSEITQADVDKLASQMSDAMAQMTAAMASLPPAQRTQMETMMAGRGMPVAPVKTVFKKTGTDKVGKWACDKYEGYQGAQKTTELCTVDPSALGFTIADFDVTRQMAAFFGKLMPQAATRTFSIGRMEEQGYSGVPVRTISFSAGQTTTTEITDVTRQSFPDSLFAVPAGFQRVDMMAGLGRRGRGSK